MFENARICVQHLESIPRSSVDTHTHTHAQVGCMAIASVLGTLTALKELDLGSNTIGKDACGVLSAIARKNKTLQMRVEDQYEEEGEHEDEMDEGDGEFDGGGFEDFLHQHGAHLQQILGMQGGVLNQAFDDDDDFDSEDMSASDVSDDLSDYEEGN